MQFVSQKSKKQSVKVDETIKLQVLEIESSYIEKACANAHNLPFSDGSVDCVLSISLLKYLENPERCVEELYRVLKPDGATIIQFPNLQYPFEPHIKMATTMPNAKKASIKNLKNDWLSLH